MEKIRTFPVVVFVSFLSFSMTVTLSIPIYVVVRQGEEAEEVKKRIPKSLESFATNITLPFITLLQALLSVSLT